MGIDAWVLDVCMDEETMDEEMGLDEVELYRLSYLAEHPELLDSLIWFLPQKSQII